MRQPVSGETGRRESNIENRVGTTGDTVDGYGGLPGWWMEGRAENREGAWLSGIRSDV